MAATGVTAAGAYRSTIPTPYGRSPISGAPFAPVAVSDTQLAVAIDDYIRAKNPTSPLIGQGAAIVAAGRRHHVDPTIIVGVAQAETQLGSTQNTGTDVTVGHNAWGLGPHLKYPTWEAGIDAAAATLARLGANQKPLADVLHDWVQGPNSTAALPGSYLSTVQDAMSRLGGHINPGQPLTSTDVQGQPISSGWGKDVLGIFGGVLGQLSSVLGFLGGLLDPHNLLRLGEDVVGVLALAGAALALIKGRPMAGLGLAMGGYLFLYAGVKDVSPLAQVRDAFQPASSRTRTRVSSNAPRTPAAAPAAP